MELIVKLFLQSTAFGCKILNGEISARENETTVQCTIIFCHCRLTKNKVHLYSFDDDARNKGIVFSLFQRQNLVQCLNKSRMKHKMMLAMARGVQNIALSLIIVRWLYFYTVFVSGYMSDSFNCIFSLRKNISHVSF